MVKKGLVFGGLSGGIMVLLLFISYAIMGKEYFSVENYATAEAIGYITMLLALSLVFFGVRHFRNKNQGGILTFRKGLLVGTLISGVGAIIMGLYTAALFGVLIPDLGEQYFQMYLQTMQEQSGNDPAVMAQLEDYKANQGLYMSPAFQGVVMFFTVFLIGEVIAIISALILKRPPVEEEGQKG